MKRLLLRHLFVLVVAFSPLDVGAAEKGWFGLGFRTEFDGFFWNPILESVSIALVAPNSPAANEHLAVGDAVVEIDGIPVSGAKGEELKKLKAILDKSASVGDTRQLKLKRANGDIYSVVLTAAARPD